MRVTTTVAGYPRIGPNRELKRAVEDHWAGRGDLEKTAAALRRDTFREMNGLDVIPSNTFSRYDHVLDTIVMTGAVPGRFRHLQDPYFTMARGADGIAPLEMTKWFDTNYHYLVPEFTPGMRLTLDWRKPLAEYREARELGLETRPVLLGPLSFQLLGKGGWVLDGLIEVYAELLERLAAAGVTEVQLDEPVLAADRTEPELAALHRVYERLGDLNSRPRLLVSTYFGEIGPALGILAGTRVEAIGLDFVAGPGNLDALAAVGGLREKALVAGVVDGRNVWRTDMAKAMSTCAVLLGLCDRLVVSTSCSLLHVPLDLDLETGLAPEVRSRLAFARQKVAEVIAIGHALNGGPVPAGAAIAPAHPREVSPASARTPFEQRAKAQLDLPPLATTTIGSFPQTAEIRQARAALRAGTLSPEEYEARMRAEIDRVIALQEDIGLDVLVHGEPERNDMVQYFAELLDGYAATEHGWVQSYGSRCVRPPILYGDITRPQPMTVPWAAYAQSRTRKPVKGMLTGPVTMLAWSFVRDDQPLAATARQVARALREEIADLEAAGIRVIQVDEPALRELLPLRDDAKAEYLTWAVDAFRLATGGAADGTQIHTHMCYSEFGEIIDAIADLDADVTSVEAARSRMELLDELRAAGYHRGIGPGVWDIHSPRVPSAEELTTALRRAVSSVDPALLWVNPDCGLKTRAYPETEASLRNMVTAAQRVRAEIA
ncbi:5-methyltetrahydropteroyltriglutamate--homocysteine methyltransferase [Acrocarpospora pleiomorpha]|uniref:5-methyltetrahydropteroyltriglutamate--homocysteine methyltransferase n=1 Tax=Acrocarpospora pleiomorpha TaxID=90975 RepID=A0A5M3XFG3_9ACTN|nr:5-methyltetrahydropteroyltriglutamate--homocysteine S-methyltransferase [Acrocarpospora pleiomorpha]GES20335.1 5-methyltetrahydropteroyltriglutamate--homocysteine methyltransferase [Acrocarpospora pleiomorpha]